MLILLGEAATSGLLSLSRHLLHPQFSCQAPQVVFRLKQPLLGSGRRRHQKQACASVGAPPRPRARGQSRSAEVVKVTEASGRTIMSVTSRPKPSNALLGNSHARARLGHRLPLDDSARATPRAGHAVAERGGAAVAESHPSERPADIQEDEPGRVPCRRLFTRCERRQTLERASLRCACCEGRRGMRRRLRRVRTPACWSTLGTGLRC